MINSKTSNQKDNALTAIAEYFHGNNITLNRVSTFSLDDEILVQNLTDTERWIWGFISCLRLNPSYFHYCFAIKQEISDLKQQFETEQIKSLYDDFGNLLYLTEPSEVYKLIQKVKPLFSFTGDDCLSIQPTNTDNFHKLWISKTASKADLKSAFKDFIDNQYTPTTSKYRISSSRKLNRKNLIAFEKCLIAYYALEIECDSPIDFAFSIFKDAICQQQSCYYHYFNWGKGRENEIYKLSHESSKHAASPYIRHLDEENSISELVETKAKALPKLVSNADQYINQVITGEIVISTRKK